jgi:high-affinity Fe2+/Pb2+ permease
MRKTILTLVSVGALALATPALAQSKHHRHHHHHHHHGWVAPAAGVAVGTVAGIGLYEGWFGSSAFATSLGSSAASSAVAGGVIGVGAAALIHAAVTPCTGFHALAAGSGCVNGQYVGHQVRYR